MNQDNGTIDNTTVDNSTIKDAAGKNPTAGDDQATTAMPVTTDEAPTETFPRTAERAAAAEAPTQTLDPERIRAQRAETETIAPIGDDATGTTTAIPTTTLPAMAIPATTALPTSDATAGTNAATAADETLPLDARLANVADPEDEPAAATTAVNDAGAAAATAATAGSATAGAGAGAATAAAAAADDMATQPMISKPDVTLAGTEETPDDRRHEAWDQQQAAAQGYADEASRNNYPGSGTTAQATAGPQYANYPGWNQYAPQPAVPYTPKIEYRKGPNAPTIVWGVLVALFALGGIASSWLFGFTMSPDVWTLFGIVALVIVGVALVVGGITSALHRRKNPNHR